jgi:lactoylglutathione lyase
MHKHRPILLITQCKTEIPHTAPENRHPIKKEKREKHMKFVWSTLYVKDLEQSLKFYQEIVGLSISRRFPAGPGREIVFLGDGETQIELIQDEKRMMNIQASGDFSWGFLTENLEATYDLCKEKGVPIYTEIVSPQPNVRFFYVLDPNGLKVQFAEQK